MEQHRLEGQYKRHFRSQNTIAEEQSQQRAQQEPRSLTLATTPCESHHHPLPVPAKGEHHHPQHQNRRHK